MNKVTKAVICKSTRNVSYKRSWPKLDRVTKYKPLNANAFSKAQRLIHFCISLPNEQQKLFTFTNFMNNRRVTV